MALREFVLQVLDDVQSELQMSLSGMSLEQLLWRPGPASNPMAWLAWHIARLQDARAAALSGQTQLWTEDGWHSRFGMAADAADHGRGHTDRQVDAVRPESVDALVEYAAAAHGYLRREVARLPDPASDAPLSGDSGDATVKELVFRAVHGGLAHVGQLMYVRGLAEKRHWFPR